MTYLQIHCPGKNWVGGNDSQRECKKGVEMAGWSQKEALRPKPIDKI